MFTFKQCGDWIYARLMGLSYRDKICQQVWASQVRDAALTLEADPQNKVDPYAVKILCNGYHVGFLPRELAHDASKLLALGTRLVVLVVDPSMVRPCLRYKIHPNQEQMPWEDLEKAEREEQWNQQGPAPKEKDK